MKSYTFNTYKLGVSLVVLLTGTLLACAATVTTDQADYPPGSTAVITGSGFTPGETVELQVINLTNPGDIGVEHDPWPVTADAGGNFMTTWYVTEDEADTSLKLTATGLTSGLVAQTTFTDAGNLSVSGTVQLAGTGSGISGVTVTGYSDAGLTTVDNSQGTGAGTTTTAANGSWTLNLLKGTTRYVVVTVPAGYITNSVTLGSNPGNGISKVSNIEIQLATGSSGGSSSGTLFIFKKTVAVSSGLTANNKTYDGTTTATISSNNISFSGVNAGDTANVKLSTNGYAATFASAAKANAITVTVGGLTLTGSAAGNYVLTQPTLSANITAATLSVTANNDTKTYGQTKTYGAGQTTFTSSGLQNGETIGSVTITASGGMAANAAAGTYNLTPSAATGGTFSAANYSITYNSGTLTVGQAGSTISVSSSLNPSGYKAGVNFLAAGLPADATGNVIFLANRAPFSTNTLSGGSATSVTISLLPRGTNTITAQYAGDGNYLGSTSDLAFGQMVTNHPPVAGTFVYTNGTRTFKLAIASLLTNNVTDADGDAISLAGFSVSTNGVNLLTNATVLYYSNTNYCNDRFSYIVKDGFGGSSTGLVSVVFNPFNSGTLSTGQSGKVNLQANGASLRFYGIPGYRYSVQRTTNMVDWVTLGATNAASNGALDYNDNFSDPGHKPDTALYRLVWTP